MTQRKISSEEVEAVIDSYHTSYPDHDRGSMVYIGHPSGRRIKVVVAQGTNAPLIVAVAD